MFQIPLTQTTLGEEEAEAAARVVRTGWLTMGAEVAAFEEEFAAAMGARHAVAVANGTAALEIVYRAAGLEAEDDIIMPALTFVASGNAARLLGAHVVLADVAAPEDLTLCPADAARKITPRTRAVVAMPYGGFCPAMEELEALCQERGLVLIEDACHAPLARLKGRPIGTFGAAATWSFFGNKNMTTGEGGMITTGDPAIADRCRLLRAHGMTRPTWARASGQGFSYDVAEVGTNARLDEIRAAIGRVQLAKLPASTQARSRAAAHLRAELEARQIPGLLIPFARPRGEPVHHIFPVLLPEGTERQRVMEALRDRGIQTSIHYPPMHRFTAAREYFERGPGRAEGLKVTEGVAGRLLSLPLGPLTTEQENAAVAEALAVALGG